MRAEPECKRLAFRFLATDHPGRLFFAARRIEDPALFGGKLNTACYYFIHVLPEAEHPLTVIEGNLRSTDRLAPDAFSSDLPVHDATQKNH